ncbi:MAG: VanW family protein [Lachnospiraceae bacterium]|nr:VanW family protein [Lachnospiraceae bacterium]
MKNKIFTGLLLSLLGGMLICGTTSYAKTTSDEIAMGVYVEEVNVSGMTKDEAKAAVNEYIAGKTEEKITLTIGEEELNVSRADLGVTWSNEEVIDEALGLGKSGNLIRRYKALKDLEFDNKVFELEYTADSELVQTVVSEKCTKYNQKATNVGLKKTSSGFEVVEGKQGVVVDESAATDVILSFIEGEYSAENTKVAVPTMITEPIGSAEELAKVKDLLGSFKTSFKSSDSDRSKNVRTGAGHIDGTVLYPGETFSTYEYVNPFTEQNGYAMAGSYLNGKVVDSLGGGICQVSSTLYNAVLMAELEVVERSPHSMMVTYVQPSADAAIAGTYKDFKFKNDTDAPIYIEGYTTDDKQIVFNIYGEETRPSNRTIKYTNKVLESTPAVTQLVADSAQGIGYRLVESGHNGCKAELYKEVYIDGVLQSSERVNKSNYQVSNRTVYYGINGDPSVSAQLQQCIAAGDEAGANALLGI